MVLPTLGRDIHGIAASCPGILIFSDVSDSMRTFFASSLVVSIHSLTQHTLSLKRHRNRSEVLCTA